MYAALKNKYQLDNKVKEPSISIASIEDYVKNEDLHDIACLAAAYLVYNKRCISHICFKSYEKFKFFSKYATKKKEYNQNELDDSEDSEDSSFVLYITTYYKYEVPLLKFCKLLDEDILTAVFEELERNLAAQKQKYLG